MSHCIDIRLTESELMLAAWVGLMRQVANVQRARRPRYGAEQDDADWQKNILGACGELAVAKHLDLFWSGWLNELGKPDVGPFHVRTAPRIDCHLIIHPADQDCAPFVFVTGQNTTYTIWGWLMGSDAKQEAWWNTKTGRPAYFVPVQALIHDLQLLWTTEAWAQYQLDQADILVGRQRKITMPEV